MWTRVLPPFLPLPFLGSANHISVSSFPPAYILPLGEGGDSRGTQETVAANTAGQDRHTLTEWATRDFQSTKGPFVCGGIRFPYVNSSVPRPLPSVAQWPTGQDCSSSAANEKKRRPMQKLQPISARKIEDDRLYVCPGHVGMIYLNFIPKDENGKALFVLTFFIKSFEDNQTHQWALGRIPPPLPSLSPFGQGPETMEGEGKKGPPKFSVLFSKFGGGALFFLPHRKFPPLPLCKKKPSTTMA